ncbi:uncharacterized protein CEXT_174701 [Caerostris extrusa]|uniref:Ycf2 n=1 Tax=Caerostris extrusa TaxID=172846 RepID=A0AAV4QM94_CAEEX|nr:uncharacterized protein CEXT_174701 [Caerostris extrusa]
MQENKDLNDNPEIFAFRSSTVREERRMSDFDLWDMLLFGARRPKIKTPPLVPFRKHIVTFFHHILDSFGDELHI